MKYIYYCNSPYQLFNIINLNWHRKYNNFENIDNYEADLIILNAFGHANEIVDTLNSSKMFNNVSICNRFNNKGLLHSLESFLDIVFPKRFLSKSNINNNIIKNNEYDILSLPKISKVMLSLWSINKKADIELYEEGFGTYCGGRYMCTENGNHEEIYSFLNNGKKFKNCFKRVYVNDKSLYLDEDKEKLISIPKMNNACIENCKSLFNSLLFEDNKSIYWIGQYGLEKISDITENILSSNKNDVIYCPHPRFKQDKSAIFENNRNNNFWEMNLSRFKDINNKLLISVHSTASISPKLLYNYEPYLILTLNMTDDRYQNKDTILTYEIIEKFIKTYSDPSKIMLPNNEDELKDCINKYLERCK